jgi:3-oxoacyl-[acyl-carrier-protein] synthase III
MKVGFEVLVRHTPRLVLTKEHFAYLRPALLKLPPEKRAAFSVVPDEIRKYAGREGGRALNMAIEVAQEALRQGGLTGRDIDFVLGAGPGVHGALGLRLDTPMLNAADCCAGFVNLLQIAWMLAETGEAKRILVVASAALAGGEPWSTTDLTDPIAPNFGDGAAAAIVSGQNLNDAAQSPAEHPFNNLSASRAQSRTEPNLKCEFLAYDTAVDGRGYHSACGDISPLRNPDLAEAAGAPCPVGPFFRMDDISYIKVATEPGYLADSLKRMCKAAGIEMSEIDALICHHLGDCEAAWKRDLAACGLEEGVFKNLRLKYGNTGHTDIPSDLLYFIEQGIVKRGSIVVLWVPGSGVSLGGLMLRLL